MCLSAIERTLYFRIHIAILVPICTDWWYDRLVFQVCVKIFVPIDRCEIWTMLSTLCNFLSSLESHCSTCSSLQGSNRSFLFLLTSCSAWLVFCIIIFLISLSFSNLFIKVIHYLLYELLSFRGHLIFVFSLWAFWFLILFWYWGGIWFTHITPNNLEFKVIWVN